MKQVKVYTKDFCPFCDRAKAFLKSKSLSFEEINIQSDPELASKLFEQTGFRTVPQIFIGDSCIGGYQEMMQLEQKGEFDKQVNS